MPKTAAAAIIKNKKILLIKRSKNSILYPGYWTMPGGKAKNNETPKENVIREVKEETNLDFIPSRLIASPDKSDKGSYIFIGDFKGTINLQIDELDEYNWFSYTNTLNLNLAFNFKDVIDILHKNNLF